MEIIAYRPPPGVWRGIDTAGDDSAPGRVITYERALELRALGYYWVARYTTWDGWVPEKCKDGGEYGPNLPNGCYPLSYEESRWILRGGLWVVPVQFGRFGRPPDGATEGRAMAAALRRLAFPLQVHHHMDVEGSAVNRAGPHRARSYMEAKAAANNSSGGLTGLYYTKAVPLTGPELYGLRGVTSYWVAGYPGDSPWPRGPSIVQDPPRKDWPDEEMWFGDKVVADVLCDTNTMYPDRMGQCPIVVATRESAERCHMDAFTNVVETYGEI